MNISFARTVDDILVRADLDTIFHYAVDIQNWPSVLPHYRWVKTLKQHDGNQTVEMAARRNWIPVKWTSIQTVDESKHTIHYHHTAGATRGMDVEWSLEKEGDAVHVTIIHEMTLTTPVVRSTLGRWIVGKFFVHYIASQTLQKIKELSEAERTTI